VLQGFGVHHALNPDPYRGVFGNDGKAYAEDVKDLIASATPGKVGGAGGTSDVAAARSEHVGRPQDWGSGIAAVFAFRHPKCKARYSCP
jgi:hypothetical protein